MNAQSRRLALSVLAAVTAAGIAVPPSPAFADPPAGTAFGWGVNNWGDLGDGSTLTPLPSPVPVAGLDDVTQLTSGDGFFVALHADGTVSGWGLNAYGELGDDVDRHPVPTAIPGLHDIVEIGSGRYHVMAVDADGNVWAWGWNAMDHLGDPTAPSSPTPIRVPNLTNIVQVAGGAFHSVALRADGTVWSWGDNSEDELGDRSMASFTTPAQVPGLSGIVQIAVGPGGAHTLALRADGTVWGFGTNYSGELGNGETQNPGHPVQVLGLSGVTQIAAGEMHSLAVANGEVYAWGENAFGELGDGTQTSHPTPVRIGLTNVVRLATAYSANVAVRADGSVWVWGFNYGHTLGTGSTDTYITNPLPVPGIAKVRDVATDLGTIIALTQ
jgi:alpha-tubulin suppressor-like RCC1 family protein